MTGAFSGRESERPGQDGPADPGRGSDAGAVSAAPTPGKGRPTPTRDGRRGAAPLPARLVRFLREVVAELRKVIWPTRKDLVTYTIVVLVFVSFMVALVAVLDYVFAKGVFAVFGNG